MQADLKFKLEIWKWNYRCFHESIFVIFRYCFGINTTFLIELMTFIVYLHQVIAALLLYCCAVCQKFVFISFLPQNYKQQGLHVAN